MAVKIGAGDYDPATDPCGVADKVVCSIPASLFGMDMKDNSVFADAFNYLIYGGEAVVDPKQLQELDTTEIALPFGTQNEEGKQPEEAVQKYRDVLKSAITKQDDEAAYILLGIENQTDIHYAMPVRNIIYDALQYGKQVADIAAKHRASDGDSKGHLYLIALDFPT